MCSLHRFTCRLTAAVCAPSMPLSRGGLTRPVRGLLMRAVASALEGLLGGRCPSLADYGQGARGQPRGPRRPERANVAFAPDRRGGCRRLLLTRLTLRVSAEGVDAAARGIWVDDRITAAAAI